MSRTIAFLPGQVLLCILTKLHLQQVLDHLVEDRIGVIRSRHVSYTVGHLEQEVSQCLQCLLLLQIFPEMLITIFDQAFYLLKHHL